MRLSLEYVVAPALIFLFLVLGISSMSRKSATVDEFAHLAVGVYAWRTGDFSLYNKTPPLGRLIQTSPLLFMDLDVPIGVGQHRSSGWLPWKYGALFQAQNIERYGTALFTARSVTILLGVACLVLVWLVSRCKYGPLGGIISLGLAALSPTLLAHSRLVTSDVPAAFCTLIFTLALLHYMRRPGAGRSLVMGIAAAIMLLVKFTAPFFIILGLCAPLAAALKNESVTNADNTEKSSDFSKRIKRTAAHLAVFIVSVYALIAVGYLGQDFRFHKEALFRSSIMKSLAPLGRNIPLPRAFLTGLDHQLFDAESQEFSQSNYVLGEFYSDGRWYYYPLALAVKEPLPFLFIVLLTSWTVFIRKRRDLEEMVLLGMALGYLVFTSLFSSLQIGVRYLLPVYPLLFLLAGSTTRCLAGREGTETHDNDHGKDPDRTVAAPARWRAKIFMALITTGGICLLAGTILVWPNYLAYFNMPAGGPDNGRNLLLDSNLDWGQDLPGLKCWMDQAGVDKIELMYFGHDDPGRFGIEHELPGRGPDSELIAISANYLMGRKYPIGYGSAWVEKDDPLWSKIIKYRNQKPIATIGHSIYVFRKIDDGKER